MSEFFSPESIRSMTGGSFVARSETPVHAAGVSIDTRTIKPGQIFVALRGEQVDGHAYLSAAHDAGSPFAIVEQGCVSREACPAGMTVIEVLSPRSALLSMASFYRRSLRSTRVIAVTGSNGKTTVVRLIDQVLGSAFRGSASIKSFNNDLGVPLTVLNASPGDHYLICEIGMNARGEIRKLAAVIRPDIAVVTSIGRAHIGRLGSIEAIAHEKMSLLSELMPGGIGIVPDTDLAVAPILADTTTLIRFGDREHADLRLDQVEASEAGVSFRINQRRAYRVPLLGAHNAFNAAATIAVAGRMGLDESQIAEALSKARGPEMRLDRRLIAGIDVINDAYNANPDSMIAAVRGFAAMTPGAQRRVLILGEMLELDELSADLHREIGEAVARVCEQGHGPDHVVLVGRGAWAAAEPVRGVLGGSAVRLEPEVGDGRSFSDGLSAGDAVLLKGSRGIGLERVIDALISRSAEAGVQA